MRVRFPQRQPLRERLLCRQLSWECQMDRRIQGMIETQYTDAILSWQVLGETEFLMSRDFQRSWNASQVHRPQRNEGGMFSTGSYFLWIRHCSTGCVWASAKWIPRGIPHCIPSEEPQSRKQETCRSVESWGKAPSVSPAWSWLKDERNQLSQIG